MRIKLGCSREVLYTGLKLMRTSSIKKTALLRLGIVLSMLLPREKEDL